MSHVDDTGTIHGIQTTSKEPVDMCDFGDMTPHALVGGAQTILTATGGQRARGSSRLAK